MMESLPVEIRRMIMDHFSNAKLLTISLVSKQFNYEARTLLRDRAKLIARVGCQNVLPFMSHLEGTNVVLFSGIKISWPAVKHIMLCPRPYKILDPNVLDALDRMPLKSLSLKFFAVQYSVKKCPVIQLVKKILQDYSGVLEQLEVNDRRESLQFIREIIQDSTFPRLKIIKIFIWPGRQVDRQGMKEDFIKEMKACAPNLQEFNEWDEKICCRDLLGDR